MNFGISECVYPIKMYCPKCGRADQEPETFCRQCGIFLPDLSKPLKKGQTPEDHVRANIVLSSLTVVVCLTLSILLYTMLGFTPQTHPLIYVTGGMLLAISCWHVQTLWRSILLRRHFRNKKTPGVEANPSGEPGNQLSAARFDDLAPPSVTDRTTKQLEEVRLRSS